MNVLASFSFLIATAQRLVDVVRTRDNLHLRPATARKSVAARLVSGLGVLRAFLRRLVILIALELEWGLCDKRGLWQRRCDRKSGVPVTRPSLTYFDAGKDSPWRNGEGLHVTTKSETGDGYTTPVPVTLAKLYAQLDFLAQIAANPLAKAKRLAFYLARTRPGILMTPKGPERLAGWWGTEVSATYDAIGASVMIKSRSRPPPLPPPRTHWPTIDVL
jgi:hypothetical protein